MPVKVKTAVESRECAFYRMGLVKGHSPGALFGLLLPNHNSIAYDIYDTDHSSFCLIYPYLVSFFK
jgi:hypothetical protein